MTWTRRQVLGAGLAASRLRIAHAARVVGAPQGTATTPSTGPRFVLLGTQGGPNFNAVRGEAANAFIVDGQPYLVDCGYGTLAALMRAGINHRAVAQVFVTHLHDDHTADLAAFLSRQWTDGRVQPTTVFGPFGTERLVKAAVDFGEANAAIRLTDEARRVKPAEMLRGRDLLAAPKPQQVFKDTRVTVLAVENTHFPPASKQRMPYRSLSYRLDARGKSVAISGDTAYSAGLVELARGSDILVCEAMDVQAMRKAFDGMVARGMYADNPEGVWKHIVETHTPLEDAGRMAAEARVRTLVLSHLVPGALSPMPDEAYVAAVRRTFSGRVVVGRDQLVL